MTSRFNLDMLLILRCCGVGGQFADVILFVGVILLSRQDVYQKLIYLAFYVQYSGLRTPKADARFMPVDKLSSRKVLKKQSPGRAAALAVLCCACWGVGFLVTGDRASAISQSHMRVFAMSRRNIQRHSQGYVLVEFWTR